MTDEILFPPMARSKAELIALIHQYRSELTEIIQRLTPAQRSRALEGGWTVQDHLAHLAAWEKGIVALLQGRPRWQAMGLDPAVVRQSSEEQVNEMLHQDLAGLSYDEVLADFQGTHQQMLSALEKLSDQDLQRPYRDFAGGEGSGDPVVYWIAGNTYEHFMVHRQWINQVAENQ